jgi:D-alanine--poly(phosphoribitol) ligase subunit 1
VKETSFDPIDLFLRSVREMPERPAVHVDGRSWTYAELDHLSQRIAAWCDAVCGEEQRVAVHGARTVLAYAGILGVLRSGRAYVPLHPDHPPLRWRSMLTRASVRTAIAPSPVHAQLREAGVDVLVDLDGLPSTAAGSNLHGSREAYVMFTSGSTGEPKGVPVGCAQVAAYLKHLCTAHAFTPEDRFTQFFALSFDLSVHDLFVCWGAGACLCVPPADGALQAMSFANEQAITVWFSVPSQVALLQRMRLLRPGALPTVRQAFFCGEPLPLDLARAFCEAAPLARVVNLYGPTETTIAITEQVVGPELTERVVPLGRPFPGHAARVRTGEVLATSGEGELVLSGPQVNAGYLGRSSTSFFEAQGQHWYATGDRVRIDPEGVLHFLGRVDEQVKLAGHRVEPAEIDAVLKPLLGDGTAVTVPVLRAGATELATFIDVEMDPVPLFAALRERLPAYMLPSRIIVVDRFPHGAHGKLDRKALIELATHG